MKVTFILLDICLIIATSCSNAVAELHPVITHKYNNLQIKQMIRTYKASNSQEIRATTEQSTRFNSDFQGATDIEWKLGADVYQVEFMIDHIDYEAYCDMSNELLMYKRDIKGHELPAKVINIISAKSPDYKYEDIDKITQGNETIYKIKFEKKDIEVKVLFRPDGTIINECID